MFDIIAVAALTAIILIAGLLIYASTKPDIFHVERTVSIAAPPETIFPFINDLHRFPAWSPYEHRDPAMKKTFSGAPSGEGAIYGWEGDKNVGKGELKIEKVTAPSKITMLLHMQKPFEAKNNVDFTLARHGEQTAVTWAMQGRAPFFAKVIHIFIDVDRMAGKDFEAGLQNLKTLAEGAGRAVETVVRS